MSQRRLNLSFVLKCDRCADIAHWEVWGEQDEFNHYCDECWQLIKSLFIDPYYAYDLRYRNERNRETNT